MRHARPAALAVSLIVLGLSACGGSSSTSPACTDASTCTPPSGPCSAATCVGGACGTSFRPAGTKVSDPTPGDCKSNQCNATGSVVVGNDDTDLPSASGPCTTGTCTSGVPGQAGLPPRTACSVGGGTMCDGAGACVQCLVGADCTSGVCSSGSCQAPSCSDGVKNGAETDVDCGGGTCPACADNRQCLSNGDCQSQVCTGGTCRAPSCTDGVKNGAETAVDCGGGTCPTCAAGAACLVGTDCQSGACRSNVCAKSLGAACVAGGECASSFCVDGVCCDGACTGACMWCGGGTTAAGTCGTAPAGTNLRNGCVASPASTCGNVGVCAATGACAVWASGTVCAAASCTGGVATSASTCDGAGTCNPGGTVTCAPYTCGPTGGCLASCVSTSDCAAGYSCSSAVCAVVCGDGIVGPGEGCDTGGTTDTATCIMASGAGALRCQPSRCGDGYVNVAAGEQCDLGSSNGTAGACCSATCSVVPPAITCP